ncbi:MAG: patatin-like phospholipase family protein [Solirubrobacteraceae bacterium]
MNQDPKRTRGVAIPIDRPRRVAIACQGGGSHTAFTAGVLKRVLREADLGNYRIVALSGTSGGAVCALLAWYGLLAGDSARAQRLLDEFWCDNSATAPHEQLLNSWLMWASQLQDLVATPQVSPYDNPFSPAGLEEFRAMLLRQVDFDRIEAQPDPAQPMLVVGAVDVLSGDFRSFNSRRERISADAILASAAIPNLFRSVHVDGGTYWDGLFSQNPPIRELVDADPDEIWVIQINPKEVDSEPRTVTEIADRRNELAGNLSLHQELHFIEHIDRMLEDGLLARDGKYRSIVVRVIELARSRVSRSLGTASKVNRDPAFLAELIAHGEDRAEEFFTALDFETAWRGQQREAVMAFFTDESELSAVSPFPESKPRVGRSQIRRFVTDHLTKDVIVDLTRKQVARERVTWNVSVRGRDGKRRTSGIAEAVFKGRHIVTFRLSGAGVRSH